MQPVVTVAEMRAIDADARRDGIPEAVLVERAGTALAGRALALLGGGYGRRVVVVAGRGNNGADGRVAAAVLARRAAKVRVVAVPEVTARLLGGADLVIDAVVGTGFHGSFEAPAVPDHVPVLACDLPSGLDGDTGEARGRVLAATETVTFAALKPGLLLGDGPELSGAVTVADIGLDASRARAWVVEDPDVARLPGRPREAHKWQTAVFVVAGSPGMLGAADLCARGAARAGAGMVRLGVPGGPPPTGIGGPAVGEPLPATGWADEVVRRAGRCQAVVVGPGLGCSATTMAEVRRLVERCPVPVVVDADGLTALGEAQRAAAVLAGRRHHQATIRGAGGAAPEGSGDVVLTPHAGEQTRLTGRRPGPDKFTDARQLAAELGAVVLLKGSTTVVADAEGAVRVCRAGSSALATAGTGDVLSGMIGAFVARGLAPLEAAALAAHAHGRAAQLGSAVGLVADDLPELVARWLSDVGT
jgi:hydroxyethylthiazole kinase-like uncharacterized protein yjeF